MDLPLRKMIDVPPVWLALFVAVAWVQETYLSVGPDASEVVRVIGWGLIVVALSFVLLAAREFRRERTTIVPHQQPDALVTGGIFAFSRNPIYLADALILTGCALIWGAWPSLLLVPVFIVVITRRFVLGEEARLRAAFGARFDAYARSVRRWI